MEEIDIATVTKRSIHGVVALVSRTFVIQLITFITNFLLTVFLSPTVFGVYFVVSAAIAFLGYFSDIGLAAALIQKKEQITDKELRTTFTMQQIMVVTVVVIALLLSNFIGSFYNLNKAGIYLFDALAIAFFLSSLKTIPSIILERNLNFSKLVIPQIVETIFFSVTAVILAVKGYGVTSFTIAVLARGISGLIAMYIVAPWKIGFGFSRADASKLLTFGVPFQANSLLALAKDDLLIVYLGKVLPLAQVGYIGFAQKWAFTPLRLIMDNIIRITFPSFSRLQHEKDVLSKAIEKSIFAATFFIFPSLMGLVTLAPYFISIIPKYSKWEPAILALTFFSLNAALSSISTPLTNALNAIGKIKITLYLMVFWTIATWVVTPFAIMAFGFNGVAIASGLISFSVIIVIYLVKRYVKFSVSIIGYPLLATIVMGAFIYFSSPVVVSNIWTLLLMIILGAVVYSLSIYIFAKKELVANLRIIRENINK
jgi:O-antigen/teichoic acid export membrane protein